MSGCTSEEEEQKTSIYPSSLSFPFSLPSQSLLVSFFKIQLSLGSVASPMIAN